MPGAATVPLTPTPAPAGGVASTPKKDTVRIEVPSAKQAPQATVKLQQTQPLIRPPVAEVRTVAAPRVVDVDTGADDETNGVEEGSTKYLAAAVLIFAAATFVIELLSFLSAGK